MTPELILVIAGVVAVLLVGAAAFYIWVNWSPGSRRDPDEVLPLFGGDLDVDGQQWVPAAAGLHGPPPVERPRTPPNASLAVAEPPGAPGSAVRSGTTPASSSVAVGRSGVSGDTAFGSKTVSPTPPPARPPMAPQRATPPSSTGVTATASMDVIPPTIRTFNTASVTPASSAAKANSSFAEPVRSPSTVPPSTVPPRTPPSVPAVGLPPNSPVFGHGVPGTMIEGHLVRFSVPAEGTLQFLPGRLEIGSGVDSGREIRFVHVPGPSGTEVTFGRSDGELYRHVQLRDQTVSRAHARMRLHEGRWYLLNLSKTNPVVHNGTICADATEHALDDGDRIEMGEVLFTFRSR